MGSAIKSSKISHKKPMDFTAVEQLLSIWIMQLRFAFNVSHEPDKNLLI